MDRDRIEGKGKQIKGKLKDVLGSATSDPDTELEGKVERGVGKVQEGWGKLKDEGRAEIQRQNERTSGPQ